MREGDSGDSEATRAGDDGAKQRETSDNETKLTSFKEKRR
jgi:hypothetical protein